MTLSNMANCLTENRYHILTVDRKMQLSAVTFAVESIQKSKFLLYFGIFLVNINFNLVTNFIFKISFEMQIH